MSENENMSRFTRQMAFDAWGPDAQKSLQQGRVLIIGVGGLGSWTAELLARSGVGLLRLVDDDLVELVNIHRQALYSENEANARSPKVSAAADRLQLLNQNIKIETISERVDRFNISRLAKDIQVIVDGTDNFLTRFIINDYCVKNCVPWVFAGVVRTEGQVMTIIPGQTPCLRCLVEVPPPECTDPSCRQVGVLGPAVSAIASFQAMEALKLIAGKSESTSPYLFKVDMWHNTTRQILCDGPREKTPCPCCGLGEYHFLEL